MKPYRVKRGGKLIGNFIVVHDGNRVNLRTKDASEARRRAALVARGEWPPEDNGEARAVRAALEGAELPPLEVAEAVNAAAESESNPRAPTGAVAGGDGNPAPVADVPAAGAGSPSAADAVNAAAAAEGEDLDAAAKAALEGAGVDLAEIQTKLPEWLGKVHLFAQAHVLRVPVRVAKGTWPPYVKVEQPELRNLIGKLWQQKLASMNVDLAKLTPGWWLLILSGVVALSQTAAMLEAMDGDAKQPEPTAAG